MSASEQLNIILVGKPGAGKSSVSKKLSESEGVNNVDFGKYLRSVSAEGTLLGRYVTTFWSRNNLKEIGFEYFDKEFQTCFDEKKNFVLSSPKVIDDAKEIDGYMRDRKLQIHAVIELDIPSEVSISRLELAEKESSGSEDKKEEGETSEAGEKGEEGEKEEESGYPIAMKLENYENNIEEIRSYYKAQPHVEFITIDASEDLETVTSKILESLKSVKKVDADYSHLEDDSKPEESSPKDPEEESSHFTRVNGIRRAELVQLMLELAHNPKPKIPLTHPVPLFGGNINELSKRPYAIVRKLDGARRLMIVYEDSIYVISQQYNVFKCNLSLPENSSKEWNNTLFDSEIVKIRETSETPAELAIFVLDCLCASGESIRNEKLTDRLLNVKKFSEDYQEPNKNNDIKVYAQTYYVMPQLPILTKLGRNGDPKNVTPSARCIADGLVFVPTTLRYNIGCSRYLLAWKPVFLNTVELAVFRESNEETGKVEVVLKSYEYKESTYKKQGVLDPVPEGFEKVQDGTVIEVNIKNDKFSVHKLRKDKPVPSADWVVKEAIEHAKRPVSPKQLLEKVQSILKGETGRKQNKHKHMENLNQKRRK